MRILIMALSSPEEANLATIRMNHPKLTNDAQAVSWALRKAAKRSADVVSETLAGDKITVGTHTVSFRRPGMKPDPAQMAPVGGIIENVINLDKCNQYNIAPLRSSIVATDSSIRAALNSVVCLDDCVVFFRR